jgi:DHA2 family multidrug resistance protein-like MFS transporter
VGLAILTQVGASGGLPTLIVASVVISLGLAPVFGLTTELIVGSAPPERAGAASGISETGAELGGALGIAILGSIGVAIYRGELTDRLPADVPAEAAAIARDTLGSAVAVAEQLPERLGTVVLEMSREAFVHGMQLTATITAVIALGLAILAVAVLRNVRPGASETAESEASRERPASPARQTLEAADY